MPISATRKLPLPPPHILEQASLFLDFDGTLVEIAARPDAVVVEERLRDLIELLHGHLQGRLAIVSGRPAGNIHDLLDGMAITLVGSHGGELHWADGTRSMLESPRYGHATRAILRRLEERYPAILVEEKPLGLALHFRQAPDAEAACRDAALEIAAHSGLMLQPGKMVIELKLAGADKGEALRTLMAQGPMRDGRPVFVGDDETDEAGFRVAAALGGCGILVGEPRETAALYGLASVDQTLAWLQDAIGVRL
jgi:trehalose 6-phosphate phosphatase